MSPEFQFVPSEASYAGVIDDLQAAAVAKLDAAKAAIGGRVDAVAGAVRGAQNRASDAVHAGEEKIDAAQTAIGWIPWVLGGLALLGAVGLYALSRPRTRNPRSLEALGRSHVDQVLASESPEHRAAVQELLGSELALARRGWTRGQDTARQVYAAKGLRAKGAAWGRGSYETGRDLVSTKIAMLPRVLELFGFH